MFSEDRPDKICERNEILHILKTLSPELVDALYNEKNYTKGGRLKITTLARSLGWTCNQTHNALEACRIALGIKEGTKPRK